MRANLIARGHNRRDRSSAAERGQSGDNGVTVSGSDYPVQRIGNGLSRYGFEGGPDDDAPRVHDLGLGWESVCNGCGQIASDGVELPDELRNSLIGSSRRLTCPLARRGHNRDGKQGKLQIEYGLLCNRSGCPVAVEVFEGNTADPMTLSSQIEKLRQRFGLKRVVLVGDRGMITQARIDKELRDVDGLDWISALRSSQIAHLMEQGAISESLFDHLAGRAAAGCPASCCMRMPPKANASHGPKRKTHRGLLGWRLAAFTPGGLFAGALLKAVAAFESPATKQ